MYRGAGDRLVPPKHARLLRDYWGRCQIHARYRFRMKVKNMGMCHVPVRGDGSN